MKGKKTYLFWSCLVITALPCAEAAAQGRGGYPIQYEIEHGDTLYVVHLPPLTIFPLPKRNTRQWNEYRRLVYNFKKVYPYALAAKDRMHKMDAALAQMPKSKDRDRLVDRYEKELFRDFEKPIRKLTFTQGRLLLKLVDREVGQTSYYVIKDLKGSFKAFFWQGIARFFGADLKKPYDKYGEVREVEQLVKMYQNGTFYGLCAKLGV